MGSEDLEGDSSEYETEHIKKENTDRDQEEVRREFIGRDDQTRGPKGLGDEIDSVEKRCESGTEMTRLNRGRCGRMCRGTCPLDAPDQ